MSVSYVETSGFDLGIQTVEYLPITSDLLAAIVVAVLLIGMFTGYLICAIRVKRGLPIF